MFTPPAAAPSAADPQLLRLNLDFLGLLMQLQAQSAGPSQLALRADAATALASCEATGLQRMAESGFSLFSLSLHRADLWQQAVVRSQSRDQLIQARYLAPAAQSPLEQLCAGFMECALFYAWHLARQNPQQARLLLGMSADTTVIVTALELWQCRHIAHTEHRLLAPRWRHHPYFWADLLRYAASGEIQHFRFAQLLGSQLMAQELEPSAILRLSSTD